MLAPIGALLAFAPGTTALSLPSVHLPVQVPDVPNPPSPLHDVTGQVTTQVNNTKNQITGQSAPPASGNNSGGNNNGGGGGPSGSGGGPNGG